MQRKNFFTLLYSVVLSGFQTTVKTLQLPTFQKDFLCVTSASLKGRSRQEKISLSNKERAFLTKPFSQAYELASLIFLTLRKDMHAVQFLKSRKIICHSYKSL